MTRTAIPRPVPRALAPLLEELELEQPIVVTLEALASIASARGIALEPATLANELQRRGWLLPLRTSGAWEFAPAARAGAIGGGDPFIELRATLMRRSLPIAVAAESAAWLLGLSSRQPGQHALGAPPGARVPRALDGFRLVHWAPVAETRVVDDLPVWAVETLLAAMASRPDGYRDWPNVTEWLSEAVERADPALMRNELAGRPRAAWARAAYVLRSGGRADEGRRLLAEAPAGSGPFHLGSRRRRGRYDSTCEVVDHILCPRLPESGP